MVTFTDVIGREPILPRRLPAQVREARQAALGLAAFGIAYPLLLAAFGQGDPALTGIVEFVPGVLLGLVAVAFTVRESRVRTAALVLAVAQIAVVVRLTTLADDLDLIAMVTVCYACGVSAAVIGFLRTPAAREWFRVI